MEVKRGRTGWMGIALLLGAAWLAGCAPQTAAQTKPDTRKTAPDADKTGVKQELLAVHDTTDPAWLSSGAMQSEIVPCDLPGIPQARKITLTALPPNYWDAQLKTETPAPLAAGTTARFRFWGRSKTRNLIYAVYEHHAEPYEKFLSQIITLTPEWREYKIVFTTPRAIPADFTGVRFQLGLKTGEFEFAGASLEDWGVAPQPPPTATLSDPYGGQPHTNAWRKAADARIDQIRKGNLLVKVEDAAGRPVSGATVQIQQTKQKFRFGTAITDAPLFDPTPDGQKYRAILLRDFNCVALENQLKWVDTNDQMFPTAERMLTWCDAHSLPVRGHNLFWPSYHWMPDAVKDLRGEALKTAVFDHVRDYVGRTRGRVYVWDVINEAVVNHEATDSMGGDKTRAEVYKLAHATDPNVLLAFNEYDLANAHAGGNDAHRAAVFAVTRQMLANGAPITALGDQAHMSEPLTPGAKLISVWNEMAQFNLPIEITEYDFATHNDKLQAEYFDEFLTAAYSHPAITSFLMWGFWEGAHWLGKEGGAMYNQDWTPRPMAKVYEDLVLHKWRTNATEKSDRKGEIGLRAFLGTHTITVTKDGKTATATAELSRSGDAMTAVTVRLK